MRTHREPQLGESNAESKSASWLDVGLVELVLGIADGRRDCNEQPWAWWSINVTVVDVVAQSRGSGQCHTLQDSRNFSASRRGAGPRSSPARNGAPPPRHRRPGRREFHAAARIGRVRLNRVGLVVGSSTIRGLLALIVGQLGRVHGGLGRYRQLAIDAVEGETEDRGGREVRVGRRVNDLHLDVGAVRVARPTDEESHCGFAVFGSPADVCPRPKTGLHPQPGQYRAAQDALRLRAGPRAVRRPRIRRPGVIPRTPAPSENSGASPRVSEKCWCEPDPTLPQTAPGTGSRADRTAGPSGR